MRLLLAALVAATLVSPAIRAADPVRYEHRVVVATTSQTLAWQINESLERNVNALGALGYEVTAIAGGSDTVVGALVDRAASDGLGQTLVVMARAIGGPVVPHDYRLIHAKAKIDLDRQVVKFGEEGFRLAATSSEGPVFHLAFERMDAGRFDYTVIAGSFRKSWVQRIQEDSALLSRLTRIVPMGDNALVELGPASSVAARFEWITEGVSRFGSDTEAKVQAKAKEGFRVQNLRVRLNSIDILLVRPAGSDGKAVAYDLDYGSWGSACPRGVIVGADVLSNGKTYCAAEDPSSTVSNASLDATARPERSGGGRVLFRAPDCETQARLKSRRPAAGRLAMASQLEREIERKVAPGYRVTRVLAASDELELMRLYVISTSQPSSAATLHATLDRAPVFTAERDLRGEDLLARREAELNQRLKGNTTIGDALVWIEISDTRPFRSVRLAGCASSPRDKEQAESVVRGLLVRSAYSDLPLTNDIIVDRWR